MPSGGRLFEVETEIEQYGTAAQATRGLGLWRKDETNHSRDKAIGATISLTWFKAPGLGKGSFADGGTVSLKGVPTFAGADVDFRVGAYVGRVTIEGRNLADVRTSGRPRRAGAASPGCSACWRGGSPARRRRCRRPAGRTAARTSRRWRSARGTSPPRTSRSQGYQLDRDFNPVAEYVRELSPAGTIASFNETVALFRDPAQARSVLVVLRATLSNKQARKAIVGGKGSYDPHPVPVRAGDDSFGLLGVASDGTGRRAYIAYTVIRVGRTIEITVIGSPTTIPITGRPRSAPSGVWSRLARRTGSRRARASPERSRAYRLSPEYA